MHSSKIHILVIEDEPAYANLLKARLAAEKKVVFSPVFADTLEKALERLKQETFDLVLLDLFLPDSSGLDSFEAVRKQAPHLPVVILTASADEEVGLQAVRMGAQDYLVKGEVEPRIFFRVIQYSLERKHMEQTLRGSEERTRVIIETANDAFIAIDKKGVIVEWNSKAELMFGWPRQDVIGKTVADTIIPPQHRQEHREGLKRFLADGEGPILNRRVEVTALRRDGHEFPVELAVWPVYSDGECRFNAFIHDISGTRKLQQMKDEFVSAISHELRTPMTIIREGVLQVLEGLHGETTESQKKFLTMTLGGVDRLKHIIDRLLDISKLESGLVLLDKELSDIVQIAREVNAAFLPRAQAKGLEIREIFPLDSLRIYVDKNKMIQVFTNLMDNALKFTDKGHIEVSILDGPQSVECRVRDTGQGISKEDLGRVFSKFEQFDRPMGPGEKGTGLGLAIAKGLVESHRGKIKVESRLGEGTQFIFFMPKHSVTEIFKEYLSRGIRAALKEKACLSVLLFEVQDYEALLTKVPPAKMDHLLKELGKRLKEGVRQRVDTALEGGHRFYAGLPSTPRDTTEFVSKRIQQVFDETIKKEGLSDEVRVRSKVVSFPEDGHTAEELMFLLHGA